MLCFSLPWTTSTSPSPSHHLPPLPSTPLSSLHLRLRPPPPLHSPLLLRHPNPRLLLPSFSTPDFNSGVTGGGGFEEELGRLLALLPETMQTNLASHPELVDLVEIVMDLGRTPLARFPSGDFVLSPNPITFHDLHHAASKVGEFAADNRAGISRTLHRISAIRNRNRVIVGLTCRVGRAVSGSADSLRDLVRDGGSLLLIGPPGVGKTTIIREIARMLADDYKKRVMIVDTSNEIGGDGDIPHPGIGNARRMQIPNFDMQHKVLIEAVENHMPQAIIIDEIGTKLEALAASTIAQRGIQLVATAHGVTIENLIMNPSLEMLVGGIQSVTLGDEEASRRGGQKTILERKGPSTFTCGVEIISKTELRIHHSLEATVDALLSGRSPTVKICKINSDGFTNEMITLQSTATSDTTYHQQSKLVEEKNLRAYSELVSSNGYTYDQAERTPDSHGTQVFIRLYVYGIAETSVVQAIRQMKMDDMIQISDNISDSDAFLALHAKLRKNSQIHSVAKSQKLPVFVTKTSSLEQIAKALRALVAKQTDGIEDSVVHDEMSSSEKTDALEEARLAIEQMVIPKGEYVELLPRPSHILSAQIDLVRKYNLKSVKVGEEPDVYIRILPFHGTADKIISANLDDANNKHQDFDGPDSLDNSDNGITRLPLLPD